MELKAGQTLSYVRDSGVLRCVVMGEGVVPGEQYQVVDQYLELSQHRADAERRAAEYGLIATGVKDNEQWMFLLSKPESA